MTRLTTREVCALGRFSRATMWRRVRKGWLPGPIDHAREALFDDRAVRAALAEPRSRWRPPPPQLPLRAAPGPRPRRVWSSKRWENPL